MAKALVRRVFTEKQPVGQDARPDKFNITLSSVR